MSTLIFGGLGAAIGSEIPVVGWKLGAQIGMAVGSLLEPGPAVISDQRISNSQFGTPILRSWGTVRNGCIIPWVAKDANGNHLFPAGGKGKGAKGGSGTSYQCSLAFYVAQATQIAPNGDFIYRAVYPKRLIANKQIVWDVTNGVFVTGWAYGTSAPSSAPTGAGEPNPNGDYYWQSGSPATVWQYQDVAWVQIAQIAGLGSSPTVTPLNGTTWFIGTNPASVSQNAFDNNYYYDTSNNCIYVMINTKWMQLTNSISSSYTVATAYTTNSHGTRNTVEPTWYPGTETQTADSDIAANLGTGANTPAFSGICYGKILNWNVGNFGNSIPNLEVVYQVGLPGMSMAAPIQDYWQMAGNDLADLDVSQVTDVITGYQATAVQSPRSDIDQICAAYGYDLVDTGSGGRLVKRGGGPVCTVPVDDLGYGKADGAKIERTQPELTTLPYLYDFEYYDVDNNCQTGSALAYRSNATTDNVAQDTSCALFLHYYEGLTIAKRKLQNIWVASEGNYSLLLPPAYMQYLPGDVLLIPEEGLTQRVRITEITLSGGIGPLEVKAVRDQADTVTQSITGSGSNLGNGSQGGGSTGTLTILPLSFFAWSGTELRDEDQGYPGMYVGACLTGGASGSIQGTIYYKVHTDTQWIQASQPITNAAVFGACTGILSDSGAVADTWDTSNTVDVDVSMLVQGGSPVTNDHDGTLEMVSDSQVIAGTNICVAGSEILGVSDPTLTATNQYTLSDLYRGMRSSAMSGHASDELFFLADPTAIVHIAFPASYSGLSVDVMVVAQSENPTSVTPITITIAAPTATVTTVASGSSEGAILYVGAGGVVADLAPGTAGDVLQTNGAGSPPSFVAPGGGTSYAVIVALATAL